MRAIVPVVLAILVVSACSKPAETATTVLPAATMKPSQTISALPTEALKQLDRYETQARALVSAIDASQPQDELDAHAEELVATSEAILPAFVALRPHCTAYLNAALALKTNWTTMTPDQIEAGYHKDGAMPKTQNATACYHMKDLIVHPITAMALLREGSQNAGKARHEIEEVVAHVSVVKATR